MPASLNRRLPPGGVFACPVGQYVESSGPGMLLDEVDQVAGRVTPRAVRDGAWISRMASALSPGSSVSECTLVGLDIGIAADVGGGIASLPPRDTVRLRPCWRDRARWRGWQPLPLRVRGVAQGLDSGKQFVGIPDAQHASPADGGIIDIVETVGRSCRPLLRIRMGLLREAARAAEKVPQHRAACPCRSGWRGSSRPGELIQQLAKVDVAMTPREMKAEAEADFALLGPIQDEVVLTAADWERNATCPESLQWGKAGVDTLPGGSMPMLLGPSSRMPCCRQFDA